MKEELIQFLAKNGCQGAIASSGRVEELCQEIQTRHREGLIDEGIYQEYLAGFLLRPPENFPEARSIIVVASPDPQVRFTFAWKGTIRHAIVPPTYLHGRKITSIIEEALTKFLQPGGHRVIPALLPKKLLAVRSGLAQYGRNNIAYVEGMGSFHRLSAFYSDISCIQDDWLDSKALPQCEKCSICRRSCPTGAIPGDRFLLRAERCIVFHNEKPSHIPFPDWLDPSWHNCLVGCMICQQVCPENRRVLDFIREDTTFSESETGLLLKGVPLEQLPLETAEKLRSSDLAGLLDMLPRNLQALLNRSDI